MLRGEDLGVLSLNLHGPRPEAPNPNSWESRIRIEWRRFASRSPHGSPRRL